MMASTWLVPFLLLAWSDVRSTVRVDEEVDLIELNHFYDENGRHVYDQVIFYEWASDLQEFHVRAFCLVDARESVRAQPIHRIESDRWRVRWYDKEHRVLKQNDSHFFRETWSQVDPERLDKKNWTKN